MAAMLQYFDAHVRAEALDDERLENLAYFNVRTVLLAAHAPRGFETSHDVLAYFNELVTSDVTRLRSAGVDAAVALGVHPRAVPRRAHYELWRELPVALTDPAVVALGELALERGGRGEEALLLRQLGVARDLGLPVLVSPGPQEQSRRIRRILELVAEARVPPARVLVNHVDFTSLRPVLEAGCSAGVTIGPSFLAPDEATELIRRYGDGALERCAFGSSLSEGPADVLALPKAAMALLQGGFSGSQVRRLVWGNAYRLFIERRRRRRRG
jgi:predicted metal-dependent TIM-barrel fold hydrolase